MGQRQRRGRGAGRGALELDFVGGRREDLLHHAGLDLLEALRHGGGLIGFGLILAIEILVIHARVDLWWAEER